MLKKFLLYFIVFLFIGCGYKPTTFYAKNAINGKVYVDLDINIDNNYDSILIKDTVNAMVLNQFNATLTYNKNNADTYIYVKLNNISHSAISTDNEGYTNRYRTTVTLNIKYNKKDQAIKSFDLSSYDDYLVDKDSTVTESNKQRSIIVASSKALDDMFTKIAVISINK